MVRRIRVASSMRLRPGATSAQPVMTEIPIPCSGRDHQEVKGECAPTSGQSEKTLTGGRNNPWALSLTLKRRAKPPSPSPSITRRRTPAALAVGVHPFEGPAAPQVPQHIHCILVPFTHPCASTAYLTRINAPILDDVRGARREVREGDRLLICGPPPTCGLGPKADPTRC
jgi:hypothetical protein